MKPTIFLLSIFLSSTLNIFAQESENLVLNGDFETLISDSLIHTYLPTKAFDLQMKGWTTPSYGSTDVLNPLFWYDSIPLAKKGKNAVGMIINSYRKKSAQKITRYSEYVQAKLKVPLTPNRKYLVKFDICGKSLPREVSQYFGISLTKKEKFNLSTNIMSMSPQVKMRTALTKKWQTISEIFTPKEAYEYITVGFFDPTTNLKQITYAVDNVTITEVSTSANIADYLSFMGEEVVLSNVHFNTNSSKLLTSSFSELEKAVVWLERTPEYSIEIQGHTDNQGDPKSNMKLSKERATAVYQYLVNKGIPTYQIQQKGYGETIPIANNKTDEGRATNRRVMLKKINILSNEDLYTEALKSIQGNKIDNAIAVFQRMIKISDLPMHLLVDPDLSPLHNHEDWETKIKTTIIQQFQNTNRVKNKEVAFELKLMLLENQAILQSDSVFWKGIRPFRGDFQIKKQDLITLNKKQCNRLNELFSDAEILPGRFEIGISGVVAIFTIIKSADSIDFQKEWLKKMQQSIRKKTEYRNAVAFLTDQIAVRENRPQIYGTQQKDGKLYRVDDPNNLNKRRKSMSLPSINF